MTVAERKSRPRRIAADEAHAWARNLRLGNPYAKLVLCMLTLYVDGDGRCFVSIAQLAEDCEFAAETVRRRLAWLEEIGAVARFAQWVDEHGRRNSDGKGRRTSDEIRLLIDADQEQIEISAGGADPPLPVGGQADERESVSPPGDPLATPSLRTGPDSLNPEPEKNPPNPPSGGVQATIDQDFEDDLTEFGRTYPAPITNLPRLRTVLAAMAREERKRVLLAVKGYAEHIADCERRKKPRGVKDADRWVAAGMWQGYLLAGEVAEAQAQRITYSIDSTEGRAWINLCRMGGAVPFVSNEKVVVKGPLTPTMLAFINMPPKAAWVFIDKIDNRANTRAWLDFYGKALAGLARRQLIEDHKIDGLMRSGFFAPWPWPPRADGSTGGTDPPSSLMTEEDLNTEL